MLAKTIELAVKIPTLGDAEAYKRRKEIWRSIGLEPIECARRDHGVYYVGSESDGTERFEFNVVPGKMYTFNNPNIVRVQYWDYESHKYISISNGQFVASVSEVRR